MCSVEAAPVLPSERPPTFSACISHIHNGGANGDLRLCPRKHGRPGTRRQTEQLRAAGAVEVFSEKVSGAKTDSQGLQRLINTLKQDDVLLVTKLDRLARSTLDLQNILASVKSVGANFKVLDNPSLDTTNIYGKLLFDILGALAEFERSLIRNRTNEGKRVAKANEVKLKLTHHQREQAIRMRDGKTLTDIGKLFNVSYQTIGRL
jgi:DNA invertase Pin-like site-specific DNA recombinase